MGKHTSIYKWKLWFTITGTKCLITKLNVKNIAPSRLKAETFINADM